ncbi:MAG: emp24/gp25L/p24 family protein [Thaumarchaeota archaeon]|nr:emp24/gp25L/p24 family protein [Nitrososphaerota archaeon]
MTLKLRRWLRGRIAEVLGGVDQNTKGMVEQRIVKSNEEVMKRIREEAGVREKRMAEMKEEMKNLRDEILRTLGQRLNEQKKDDERRMVELQKVLNDESHVVESLIEREEFVVAQKSTVDRTIEISLGGKRNLRVRGEFQASGESRSDVKFYVFDEFNRDKFVNKQPFHALDESPTISHYSFVIPITHPGRYHLFFDNTFSTFSPKRLRLSVKVEYDSAYT